MSDNPDQLTRQERRSALLTPIYRVLGTPIVAVLSLANTAIIVRQTGAEVFGLVSLVATITLLFPFADLGIGSTVITASAQLSGPDRDERAADVIRRSYHVLFAVAAGVVALALAIMAADGWARLIGFSSGPADRWSVTVAACVFALTIPAGLGVRILVGLNRVPLATVVLMANSVFALGITGVLYFMKVPGVWYSLSALGGLLIGQIIGTALALRITGLGISAFARVGPSNRHERLLRGSLWLFLMGVGLPVALQAGRPLLAHLSTPRQLSEYALMAQIYGVCWTVFSTAGFALWPIFVKRRSAAKATLQIWARTTVIFAVAAVLTTVVLVVASPPAGDLLSGGRISITAGLALGFGLLLLGQGTFLVSGMLLTQPEEARLQAWWALTMAAISVGAGAVAAHRYGAMGVVCAAAAAVLVAQVIPSLVWVPRLVRRRDAAVS